MTRLASPSAAGALFLVLFVVGFPSPGRCDEVIPADAQPRWWKGNIHTHTLWSDGDDFPEMVAEWYRTHDYNFLSLSDHNVLSEGTRWMKHSAIASRSGKQALPKYLARFGPDWVETRGEPGTAGYEVRLKPLNEFRALVEERGKFIMIAGEEISDRAEGRPLHMNATNIKEKIAPLGGGTVREAMAANLRAVEEQAKEAGREMLVHSNHPNFGYAVTAEDLAAVLAERFFEVYNGHPEVEHLGKEHHPRVERLWDIANTLRLAKLGAAPLYGVATDDSHHYHKNSGSVTGRGWIMVRARRLTPEALIRAVKRGDYYCSSGVVLDEVGFSPESGVLALQIAPDGDAEFTTEFIGTLIGYDDTSEPRTDKEGKPIRTTRKYSDEVGKVLATVRGLSPSYQLTGDELYVRAVVTSSKPPERPSFKDQRRQAWTQPVGWRARLEDAPKP